MHRDHVVAGEHDCTGGSCVGRFVRYRTTRDRTIRNQLVEQHQWLADRYARRFSGRGESIDDLSQVALIALIKAIERFDPDRGVSFPAFAAPTITGEIKRHFRDATWRLSVPRGPKEMRSRIVAAVDDLHQRLGRSPTPDEISVHLQVDRETVVEALFANRAYRAVSLDAAVPPIEGRHFSRDASTDANVVDVRMTAIDALRTLGERDRQIVYWRFYEGCTQREIGERLGVGQVQVSRLLRSALDRLRTRLEPAPQQPSERRLTA